MCCGLARRRGVSRWTLIVLTVLLAAACDGDRGGHGNRDRHDDLGRNGHQDVASGADAELADVTAVDAASADAEPGEGVSDVAVEGDVGDDGDIGADGESDTDTTPLADSADGAEVGGDADGSDALADVAVDAEPGDVAADVAVDAEPGDVAPPPLPPVDLAIATTPALVAAADAAAPDRVVACALAGGVTLTFDAEVGATVTVQVHDAPPSVQTSIAGTLTIPLQPGERVTVSATAPDRSPVATHVRCLPADFPSYQVQADGAGASDYYLAAILPPIDPKDGVWKSYPVVWDRYGVPLWWGASGDAVFFTLLSNGALAWTQQGAVPGGPSKGAVQVGWDGSVTASTQAVDGDFDIHDLIRLPDGTLLVAAWTQVQNVDLSAIGGPAKATIFDQVLQEQAPDGTLLWSWSAAAHIPVSEMSPTWRPQFIDKAKPPYDVHHWNAVEPIPGGYLLSFRHLDAIYAIDRTTGNVVWKLGGTTRPESLTIVGDPVFPLYGFGGQHDARMLADGSVTLHDNGSGLGRPPRVVRYAITPPPLGIATLLESHSDVMVAQSICCGSVRKVDGGAWVIGWGGRETISEVSTSGKTHFRLELQKGAMLYRAIPVAPGTLDRAVLRAGMDAQLP